MILAKKGSLKPNNFEYKTMLEQFFVKELGISMLHFKWIVLPLVIFCARVTDVSIATVRIMFVMNGKRRVATMLGFCESFIWLLAIGQIFKYIDNPACYIGYAGGYATGTYMGMLIEGRIAFGKVILRVITRKEASALIEHLRQTRFVFTVVEATGRTENVNLLFSVVERKDLPELIGIIKQYHPKAFYTIESTKFASEGGMELDSRPLHPLARLLKLTKRK